MNTKKIEATFQLLANSISKIDITNNLFRISESDNLRKEFSLKIDNICIEQHHTYKSAAMDLSVNVLVSDNNTDKPREFKALMTINGIFIDTTDITDEEFKQKLNINGSAALYSIARGCLINISSQVLEEGKIILPLVNFIEMSKKSKK